MFESEKEDLKAKRSSSQSNLDDAWGDCETDEKATTTTAATEAVRISANQYDTLLISSYDTAFYSIVDRLVCTFFFWRGSSIPRSNKIDVANLMLWH